MAAEGVVVRLCVNWLPRSLEETRAVARAVEDGGLWGLGVGDSPRYGELYAACAEALRATTAIAVVTSVTNPVTRHPSVHVAAARAFGAYGPARFRIGMGTGDSAVRDVGARPATRAELAAALRAITAGAPDTPTLVAAGGPKTAAVAGQAAGALIAGAGRDLPAIRTLAQAAEAAGRRVPVWASVRLAIGEDAAEVAELRRAFLPRAISAARFNLGGRAGGTAGLDGTAGPDGKAGLGGKAGSAGGAAFEGKNVPAEMRDVLAERFGDYDFAWHGRSGDNPTARLFADRPDVEEYLLRRFAIVGSPEECRAELTALSRHVDGVFTSIRFEDAVRQIGLLASLGPHTPNTEPAA